MKKRYAGIILFVVIIVTIFISIKYFNISTHGKLLVSATYSGGMCPKGPCGRTKNIYSFGNSDIKNLIDNTDFSKLREIKFNALCPTAYDGQKVIYTFYTSRGVEIIDSCETKIDYTSPLFVAIQPHLASQ